MASLLYLQRNMGKIGFHARYNLMVDKAEGNINATVMTHRGDVLHWMAFCQWHTVNTSSVY